MDTFNDETTGHVSDHIVIRDAETGEVMFKGRGIQPKKNEENKNERNS